MQLRRFAGNPILRPYPEHAWEALAVFNPGAWQDAERGEVLLLYRAAEAGPEYKCYFGLAVSRDGCHFERVSDRPALAPSGDGFDGSTIQDPRIVKMGDCYYVTYACRHYPFGQFWIPDAQRYRPPPRPPEFPRYLRENATLTGLLITRDFEHWIRAGWLTDPLLDDRDVVLFPERVGGQYVMIHRPLEWVGPRYGTAHAAAWISRAEDLFGFRESQLLIRAEQPWEAGKLGINTPPIRTPHGWLALYHAVGADRFYRIGAVLLDLDQPERVRYRTPHWILEPEAEYEIDGFYRGCVFPCGKVLIDGTLFVYYGAADKYVALATCQLDELVQYLLAHPVTGG